MRYQSRTSLILREKERRPHFYFVLDRVVDWLILPLPTIVTNETEGRISLYLSQFKVNIVIVHNVADLPLILEHYI
jgi:hypothetical protein